MSVIGRLDRQVDEKLIEPLSNRGDGEETRRKPDSNRMEKTRGSKDEATGEERSRERAELPVWLL